MSLDRIVIGTDFSGPSLEATEWAVKRLAPGAAFVLVHVVSMAEPPSFLRGRLPSIETMRDDARIGATHRLAELRRSLGTPRVETEVRVGRTDEELHAVAEARRADLIVVGRHGERPGIWRRLGSTAENLARAGRTPVLLATGLHDQAPRRVLAALDDSPATASVAAWARSVAVRHDAAVVAMHVVNTSVPTYLLAAVGAAPGALGVPPAAGDAEHEVERAMWVRDTDQWLERIVGRGLPPGRVTSETAFGAPAAEILAAAERHQADVVVMGTRGAGAVRRVLLGSVACEVLRNARCAVLVVPPPAA
ncbi:MAG: universal stress protein [Gemmatirosa sp.]|nr:universal stress protein [Gemmatirosa sp.]